MKQCTKCSETKAISEFYFRNDTNSYRNSCKSCEKTKGSNYYFNNKSKCSKRQKNYYEVNKEEIKQNSRNYHNANKESCNMRNSEYQKKHKMRLRPIKTANENKRRFAKKLATPNWLTKDHLYEIELFYQLASILRYTTDIKYEVDHIIPLQGKNVVGLHVPWNLQILEQVENIKKSNKVLGAA